MNTVHVAFAARSGNKAGMNEDEFIHGSSLDLVFGVTCERAFFRHTFFLTLLFESRKRLFTLSTHNFCETGVAVIRLTFQYHHHKFVSQSNDKLCGQSRWPKIHDDK